MAARIRESNASPGLQVLAIVEDVVALLGEREADRLDARPILGCVAEEDSHWAGSVA